MPPQKRHSNFSRIRLSVCMYVCNTITFESLDVESSFFLQTRYQGIWVKFVYEGQLQGHRKKTRNVISPPVGLSKSKTAVMARPFQSFTYDDTCLRTPTSTDAACGQFILFFCSRPSRCADFTFSAPQTDRVMTKRICMSCLPSMKRLLFSAFFVLLFYCETLLMSEL